MQKSSHNNNFVSLDFSGEEVEADEGAGAAAPGNENKDMVIDKGSYAKVLIVELRITRRIYAMKVIKMELVQTQKHFFETATNQPFLIGFLPPDSEQTLLCRRVCPRR